jgi:hypothetical protein
VKNQIVRTILLAGILALAGSLAPALAQSTAGGVAVPTNYDTFQPPVAGGTYVDPVFGSTIQRVSNALGTPDAANGGDLTWIENEYSAMSAFNSDNSKFILLHESYFGLYDGSSGFFMYALPFEISASSEPRWSRRDNATLYYHSGNELKSYNVLTGGIGVVHIFSEYSSISGNGEMDISLDGDHFVYVGDNEFVFVYQISTDTKFAVFDAGSQPFDSVYITPNNEVILSWYPTGSARRTGQELFDINMNFLRQVGHADGHKHLTVDANGDEVLIWTNSNDANPIANCNNGIVKIRLADASQTCLLQLDWSLAVHISAPDGNGTVFVDTEAPANPEPGTSAWVPYANELLQVKLDGSGSTTRWAHHRSRPVNTYNWEPKLDISRDGTRLLYASNYDLSNVDEYNTQYADTYLIAISNSSSASGSPPAVSSVQCSPSTLMSDSSSACMVTLSAAAPAGGSIVALATNSALLSAPSSVTVAAGAVSAGFTATAGQISSNQSARVTATLNGSSQSASIALTAPTATVSSLQCGAGSLASGASTTCALELSAAAPAGGSIIALASNSALLSAPSSVTVPAGAASAAFTATAGSVASNQSARVTATLNGSSQSASIALTAPTATVSSLQCGAGSLASGASTTCALELSAAAPSGGSIVALASNSALLSAPSSVTVPAGAASAAFTATAGQIASNQSASVTATLNGSSQSASIALTAPTAMLSALQCGAASLASGASTTCTVTLSAAAPSGGSTVALTSNSALLPAPSSVTVGAGAVSAGFSVTAGRVASNQSARVTATLNGSSQSVSIALTAPTRRPVPVAPSRPIQIKPRP